MMLVLLLLLPSLLVSPLNEIATLVPVNTQFNALNGKRTVNDVLYKYRTAAEKRLIPFFRESDSAFPPKNIVLLAFKNERKLELWAKDKNGYKYIKDYRIRGASGGAGPKLREGDLQVPEGIYKIIGFNPNSAFHLSMKLNYPNDFDRDKSQIDGRDNLGGDIFIHGRADSTGCLAMGDRNIEELFVLTALVGKHNSKVIIAPTDFRVTKTAKKYTRKLSWLPELYSNIERALQPFGRNLSN